MEGPTYEISVRGLFVKVEHTLRCVPCYSIARFGRRASEERQEERRAGSKGYRTGYLEGKGGWGRFDGPRYVYWVWGLGWKALIL